MTTARRHRRALLAAGVVCVSAVAVAAAAALRTVDGLPSAPGRAPALEAGTAGARHAAVEQPTPEPAAGIIAFVSERDGQREIYTVGPDGSRPERLTTAPAQDYAGPASPDASRLLAVAAEERSDGAHQERLTLLERSPSGWSSRPLAGPSGRLRNPAWLPDGSGVVLESDAGGFIAIELCRLDGRPAERLTHERSGSFEPAVRPDGRAIAFVSSAEGDPEIFRLELDTRQLTRLTWSRGSDGSPVWAPDGAHLAYLSQRRGAFRAYLMGADGAHPRPLLGPNDPVDGPQGRFVGHEDLAFAPDGTRVALVERREGRAMLQIVRVADGELILGSEGRWRDQTPSWSPDGRHLVFASDRSGDVELFLVDADGAGLRQLTHSPGADWLPRWLAAPSEGGRDVAVRIGRGTDAAWPAN